MMAAVLSLLLRRHNPELALLLGALTALGVLAASLGVLSGFQEFRNLVRQMLGEESETLLAPVIKCLAISLVSRLASELCRDASQYAAAWAVELAGSACSLVVVLPLLLGVLKTIGGFR